MNLCTHMVNGTVLPLQERPIHHDTLRIRSATDQSQYWPHAKLEASEEER